LGHDEYVEVIQVAAAFISLSHYLVTGSYPSIYFPILICLGPDSHQVRLLLVSSMTTLDAEVMGKFAASLERAVGIALR
jgi:tetrahydromethanopterin S-methyltransferase subunit C